jgi:hypothetical protein
MRDHVYVLESLVDLGVAINDSSSDEETVLYRLVDILDIGSLV